MPLKHVPWQHRRHHGGIHLRAIPNSMFFFPPPMKNVQLHDAEFTVSSVNIPASNYLYLQPTLSLMYKIW
jgi:hypothetical protein